MTVFVVLVFRGFGLQPEVDSVHQNKFTANDRRLELIAERDVLDVQILEKELEV